MKKMMKRVTAGLMAGGAAVAIASTLGAGASSAHVDSGQYRYQGPLGTSNWTVNGNQMYQNGGDINSPLGRMHITHTPRGGFADGPLGTRVTMRDNGRGGYNGNYYFLGFNTGAVHMTPRG